MKWSKRALCILLAFLLVLTGLNLQKHIEQPVFGATQPATGIAALLAAEARSHTDVCFMEETGNHVVPVLRQRNTSKVGQPRFAVGAVAVGGLHFCKQPHRPVQWLRYWDTFPTACWRSITSHIHRTRRKRC